MIPVCSGSAGSERRDQVECGQRDGAEDSHAEFNESKRAEKAHSGVRGQFPAGEATQPEPEHENGYDDGNRLNIYPVNGEQRALPYDLIEQGRNARDEEKHVIQPEARAAAVLGRNESTERLRFEVCTLRLLHSNAAKWQLVKAFSGPFAKPK